MAFQYASWLEWRLTAKGPHGVHSPFVFDWVTRVLPDQRTDAGAKIEALRKSLCKDRRLIDFPDFGAGSQNSGGGMKSRTVSEIAKSGARGRREGELLLRITKELQPKTILEFGTQLGLSGLYFLAGNPSAQIITMEGAEPVAALARRHFEEFHHSPEILTGEFQSTLNILENRPDLQPELVLLDGNHQEAPTLAYFEWILPRLAGVGCVVVDDIRWSKGMLNAWRKLEAHPSVSLSLDLGTIGLLFTRRKQARECFSLRW